MIDIRVINIQAIVEMKISTVSPQVENEWIGVENEWIVSFDHSYSICKEWVIMNELESRPIRSLVAQSESLS